MSKQEICELANLCLVYDEDKILVQNRTKEDWKGIVLPGGHVEKHESIVQSVIREIKEETNLDIKNPKLVGLKQFQTADDVRYLVFLFKTNQFEGKLQSSSEGEVMWLKRSELDQYNLVSDFMELLDVFDNDTLSEFMYTKEGQKRIL